jgi:hypothetical protein
MPGAHCLKATFSSFTALHAGQALTRRMFYPVRPRIRADDAPAGAHHARGVTTGSPAQEAGGIVTGDAPDCPRPSCEHSGARQPLYRLLETAMLAFDLNSSARGVLPGADRGRVLMPVRIPWPLSAKVNLANYLILN